jgi:hypothetical protein
MTLASNDKLSCDSDALYGTRPEFVSPDPSKLASPVAGGHSHGGSQAKHISEQPSCYGRSMAARSMAKGDAWSLKAHYDFAVNNGMMNENGEFDEVMGIAIMFVRLKAPWP